MDKLIKNRFWILLAVVLPMVVYGYYSANGAIKEATDTRIGQLNDALTKIPDGKGPNPTFVKAEDGGVEIYNKELRKAVDAEMVRVWDEQKARMTWPEEMQDFLPETHRGEFSSDAVFTYKAEYDDQLRKLYESLEPIKLERNGSVSGKVRYDRSMLPRHEFGVLSVPSEDIWDAQEDIWLLQVLFDAIRNANRSADNAAKSAVRWLMYLELVGGNGQSTVTSGGGGGGGATGAGFGNGRMEDGDEDFGPMGGPAPGGGGAMGGLGQISVAFSPSEEFGRDVEGGAGGVGATGGGGNARVVDEEGDEGFFGGGGRGPGGFANVKRLRYIKLDESAKFRERGFYMSVLVDQKKIADFLVELSNADWPIRVVRFNVGPSGGAGGATSALTGFGGGGRRADDDSDGRGGFGMGGGMGLRGAMGGRGAAGPMMSDISGLSAPGFSGALFGGGVADEADDGGVLGMRGGTIGAAPMLSGDQIGDLFTHPDLVQMDLCGVITMYNPPKPELLAAVTGATDAAAPAAEGDVTPAEGAAEPAGETTEPAATESDPAAAVGESTTAEPASTDPAAGEPAEGDSAAPAAEAEPAEAAAPTEAAPAGGS